MAFTPRPGDPLVAFTAEPGRCFRMVLSDQLQATHCREPVAWRGRWADTLGTWHRLEACERHVGQIEGARRIT